MFCLIPRSLGVCLSSEQTLSHPSPSGLWALSLDGSRLRGRYGVPAWPGTAVARCAPCRGSCGLPPTEESSGEGDQSPCPVPGLLAGCCLTLTPPVRTCSSLPISSAHSKGSHLFLVLCRGWARLHVLCPGAWSPSWGWATSVALPASSCAVVGCGFLRPCGCRKPRLTPAGAASRTCPVFLALNNPGFGKEIVPDSLCLSSLSVVSAAS